MMIDAITIPIMLSLFFYFLWVREIALTKHRELPILDETLEMGEEHENWICCITDSCVRAGCGLF